MAETILSNVNQEKLEATKRMLEKQAQMSIEDAKMKGLDAESLEMEKLLMIVNDKDFLNKFCSCDSKEKLRNLFAEGGLALTDEQIKSLLQRTVDCIEKLKNDDGVLSEDDLEQVAGGWNWTTAGICWGVGAVLGLMAIVLGAGLPAIVGGVVAVVGTIAAACE